MDQKHCQIHSMQKWSKRLPNTYYLSCCQLQSEQLFYDYTMTLLWPDLDCEPNVMLPGTYSRPFVTHSLCHRNDVLHENCCFKLFLISAHPISVGDWWAVTILFILLAVFSFLLLKICQQPQNPTKWACGLLLVFAIPYGLYVGHFRAVTNLNRM